VGAGAGAGRVRVRRAVRAVMYKIQIISVYIVLYTVIKWIISVCIVFVYHIYRFVYHIYRFIYRGQVRAGCACAGPYAQRLLGIDAGLAREYEAALLQGDEARGGRGE
jgi:hypothetical protein